MWNGSYGMEGIEPIILLFSAVSDTIVGLIITQFNDIHNKSLPVIQDKDFESCFTGQIYYTQ